MDLFKMLQMAAFIMQIVGSIWAAEDAEGAGTGELKRERAVKDGGAAAKKLMAGLGLKDIEFNDILESIGQLIDAIVKLLNLLGILAAPSKSAGEA